jgi:putative transposase
MDHQVSHENRLFHYHRNWTNEWGQVRSPWENGYVESFNGKLREELLNGEVFYTMKEAQILIEHWRREYNHLRPHSSLGGHPPAPETIAWPDFSLKDYAPPAITHEPALSLS